MTFSYYASYSLRSGFTLVHYRGKKTRMIVVCGMVLTHMLVWC